MKNPLTLAGIKPATFRFVAQHLNHCATAVWGKSKKAKFYPVTFREVTEGEQMYKSTLSLTSPLDGVGGY